MVKILLDSGRFQAFLKALKIKLVHTDDVIAFKSVQIRAAGLAATPKRQVKLPDATIGATANVLGLTVVTRNPRDFGASSVRIPYKCEYEYDEEGHIVNWIVSHIAPPV